MAGWIHTFPGLKAANLMPPFPRLERVGWKWFERQPQGLKPIGFGNLCGTTESRALIQRLEPRSSLQKNSLF